MSASPKKTLRERVVALAQTPHALFALTVVSVIDASVFPIPPFALLIPMILSHPKRALRYMSIGTVASIFGGWLGYGLGKLIALGLLTAFKVDPNLPLHFHLSSWSVDTTLAHVLGDNLWVLMIACSVLPTPFKIVTIGSGLVGVAPMTFFVASAIGRTLRVFGIGGATALFGRKAARFFSPKIAGAMAGLVVLQQTSAFAHVPPGPYVIAKMGEKRAGLGVADLELTLSTDRANGEQADERLYLKRGGKLRWVHATEGGETVTVVQNGRRTEILADGRQSSEAAPAEPLVDFLIPRAQNSEGAKAEVVALCTRLGIDLSIDSLGRQAGRIAYVFGSKPGEKDKPQIWIDKDSMQPLRVVYAGTNQGKSGMWDIRFMEFGSREAGDVAPHFIERWFDGALVSKSEVERAASNLRLAESLFQIPRT